MTVTPEPGGTDWTRDDAEAPLLDDEMIEAALQWRRRAREIRGVEAGLPR